MKHNETAFFCWRILYWYRIHHFFNSVKADVDGSLEYFRLVPNYNGLEETNISAQTRDILRK